MFEGQGGGEKGNKRGMSSEKPGQKLPEELLKQARYLRETQTETEDLLWQLLRNRQLANAKFRRQHPIEEGIILDFYCHKSKLALEVDGAYHNDAEQRVADCERTELLSEIGIKVIRFTNEQVLEDVEAVLAQIIRALRAGVS